MNGFFFVQRYICSAQSLPYPSQTLFIMDVLRDRNGFGLQTVGFRAESVYPCTRNARLAIKHVHFFASLPSSTLRIYTRSSPFIFVDRPRQKIWLFCSLEWSHVKSLFGFYYNEVGYFVIILQKAGFLLCHNSASLIVPTKNFLWPCPTWSLNPGGIHTPCRAG